ncbi:MAG TPA: nucleotide exchange factor GrpE [Bacillota bacterium]|nr:nucleotide exchange factor GrpE [Bacillota bacterium]
MEENKKQSDSQEEIKEPAQEPEKAQTEQTEPTKEEKKKDKKKDKELEALKAQLDALNDKYVRLTAEYENYRKRSVREKEAAYTDAYADAFELMLPMADSLDEAKKFATDDSDTSKGIKLICKQFADVMAKAGIEEIEADGKPFDPTIHNAVMHEANDQYGENTVSMVLRKGYKRGTKIIRHSMVKVAN